MSNVLTRSNFASVLWPGLHAIFGDEYKAQTHTFKQLFTTRKSTKAYERLQTMTGLGLAQLKMEGAPISYDRMLEGFQKEVAHNVYALGASISYEAAADDQYNKINKQPKLIARSLAETQEIKAYNVINNAFTTETCIDGTAIINANHPLIGGGVFSNNPTSGDLSETTMQTMLTEIGLTVDDRGKRTKLMPKKLIIPPQLQWVAQELLKSDQSIRLETNGGTGITNVNALNTLKGVLDVHMSPYLIDPDAWFIMTDADEGLIHFEREGVTFDRDTEFNTRNLNFVGMFRASWACFEWRTLWGSNGSGS